LITKIYKRISEKSVGKYRQKPDFPETIDRSY